MRVVCLFGERRGYEGDMPELMVAWDEYCIDANPEGFEKACQDAIESWGADLVAHRTLHIKIDEKELRAQFRAGELKGKIDAGP